MISGVEDDATAAISIVYHNSVRVHCQSPSGKLDQHVQQRDLLMMLGFVLQVIRYNNRPYSLTLNLSAHKKKQDKPPGNDGHIKPALLKHPRSATWHRQGNQHSCRVSNDIFGGREESVIRHFTLKRKRGIRQRCQRSSELQS